MKNEVQKSQIVIYKTPTGETKIDVRFNGDTVWLTQDALSAETKKLEAIYRQKLADLEELKKSVLKRAFEGEL